MVSSIPTAVPKSISLKTFSSFLSFIPRLAELSAADIFFIAGALPREEFFEKMLWTLFLRLSLRLRIFCSFGVTARQRIIFAGFTSRCTRPDACIIFRAASTFRAACTQTESSGDIWVLLLGSFGLSLMHSTSLIPPSCTTLSKLSPTSSSMTNQQQSGSILTGVMPVRCTACSHLSEVKRSKIWASRQSCTQRIVFIKNNELIMLVF